MHRKSKESVEIQRFEPIWTQYKSRFTFEFLDSNNICGFKQNDARARVRVFPEFVLSAYSDDNHKY